MLGRVFGYYGDATADGSRFLIHLTGDEQGEAALTLVRNWTAMLQEWRPARPYDRAAVS